MASIQPMTKYYYVGGQRIAMPDGKLWLDKGIAHEHCFLLVCLVRQCGGAVELGFQEKV